MANKKFPIYSRSLIGLTTKSQR